MVLLTMLSFGVSYSPMDDLCLEDAYIGSLSDRQEVEKTLILAQEWIEDILAKIEEGDSDTISFMEDKFLLGRGEHDDDLMNLKCKKEAAPEIIDIFHYAHIYRYQNGSLDLTKYL
jgi:hypothetical protein